MFLNILEGNLNYRFASGSNLSSSGISYDCSHQSKTACLICNSYDYLINWFQYD